jgi:hypothetical protein
MDFADYINTTVILYGISDNAAAGAVLRCGPTSHVYIDGLSQWSDNERYTALEVTGTLTEKGSDLDLRADDQTVMHGIGKHYAVENATWRPVSD